MRISRNIRLCAILVVFLSTSAHASLIWNLELNSPVGGFDPESSANQCAGSCLGTGSGTVVLSDYALASDGVFLVTDVLEYVFIELNFSEGELSAQPDLILTEYSCDRCVYEVSNGMLVAFEMQMRGGGTFGPFDQPVHNLGTSSGDISNYFMTYKFLDDPFGETFVTWSRSVPVPEPSTFGLLGAGLLGLFMRRKRVA